MTWGWDWNPKNPTRNREGPGSLGIVKILDACLFCIAELPYCAANNMERDGYNR